MEAVLKKNLEIRKALAEVDRLISENVELKERLRKKEVMLRSHERDITALRNKNIYK